MCNEAGCISQQVRCDSAITTVRESYLNQEKRKAPSPQRTRSNSESAERNEGRWAN